MKEFDCVEVIIEKEKYAREGVHKGMQGRTSASRHNLKEPVTARICPIIWFGGKFFS